MAASHKEAPKLLGIVQQVRKQTGHNEDHELLPLSDESPSTADGGRAQRMTTSPSGGWPRRGPVSAPVLSPGDRGFDNPFVPRLPDVSTVGGAPPSNTIARSRFRAAYRTIQNSTLEFLGLTDDWADTQHEQWTNQRLRLADRQGKDEAAQTKLQEQKEGLKKRKKELLRQNRDMLARRSLPPQTVLGARMPPRPDEARKTLLDPPSAVGLSVSVDGRSDEGDSGAPVPSVAVPSVAVPSVPVSSSEDDDDSEVEELCKVSVATITAVAVSKAVNKWRRKAEKTVEATATEPDVLLTSASQDAVQANLKLSSDATDSSVPDDRFAPEGGVASSYRAASSYRSAAAAYRAEESYSAAPVPQALTKQRDYYPPSERRYNVKPAGKPTAKKSKDKEKSHMHSWFGLFGKQVQESYSESRPYFTWWVTSVHICVLILSMTLYPWAPFGIGLKNITGQVLTTSLSMEAIEYEEPATIWFGPRQHALVALGAKFAPCMRWDATVQEGILRQQELEELTGCCVRHDQSGCVQTTDDQCSESLSHWDKWTTDNPGPEKRLSGPVCGQDPRTCMSPASVPPNVWADDITEWPVCRGSNASMITEEPFSAIRRDTSVNCEVIGRPCCVGIHGECHITTREHCDFLQGTFHNDASLCSQVSCLSAVCRMLDFLNPDVPDQFYRLWVSLFIHPGLVPFGLTLLLHVLLLRKLEKFAGTVRVTIIYILSGITGNLASAIFVPYRPEVGPSGSLAGMMGCFFIVFVVDVKDELRSSWVIILKWAAVLVFCFIAGLFPGIDNYANIFGFMMGCLLALTLLPHIGHSSKPKVLPQYVAHGSQQLYDSSDNMAQSGAPPRDSSSKKCRVVVVLVSMSLAIALLVTLFMLFYFVQFQCDWCGYLDCIPITPDFCAEQQTSFERHRIIT